jgi:hypothetical protein
MHKNLLLNLKDSQQDASKNLTNPIAKLLKVQCIFNDGITQPTVIYPKVHGRNVLWIP